ncbi:MAG: response regulator transcription factor [Clostridiales bacterium]
MKILIVDDDALIRDGLKMILESEDNIEQIQYASNGEEAVKVCASFIPDVVVMDIRMPKMDGVQATRLIKEQYKNIKVLMLTTFKDAEYIKNAMNYGAEGYILKSSSSESIVKSIGAVYSGNVVLEKEVATMLTGMVQKDKKEVKLNVTEKEYKIIELISQGLSNKEIAEKLFISEGTVRNNISIILDKLSLRDRTQLAIYYIKNIE